MSKQAESLVREGLQRQQAGDLDGARAHYRNALEIDPMNADALHLTGLAALQSGAAEEAVTLIWKAVDRVPDQPVLRNNLGLALHRAGSLAEAAGQLRKAIELRADYAGAHMNLAAVLSALGNWEDSLKHNLQSVELEPQRAEAWFNLGQLRRTRVELPEALEAFQRALEVRSAYPAAANSLLETLQLTPGLDPEAVAAEHRRVSEATYGPPPERPTPRASSPGAPLTIGYVSSDFRRHAVAHFFEPLLEQHDRDRFRIACYSGTVKTDEMTQRARRLADLWIDARGLDDEALAERIREDGVDILVDLDGQTRGNRLGSFARRPAALQLGWLGYPAFPGLEALDGQIVDRQTARQVLDTDAGVGLLPMEGPFAVFRPATDAPAPVPPPAQKRGYITLGAFNALEMINRDVVACWAKVLQALPDARLLLLRDELDAWHRQRLIEQFGAAGIGEERLTLLPGKQTSGDFQDFWAHIDIFLDTFPWSGHTMCCHALWCGVPVVTLAGRTHASRMVAGVLGALDQEAWVAEDEADYVARVRALAGDLDALTETRDALRARFEASALRDEQGFARRFEALLLGQYDRLAAPD